MEIGAFACNRSTSEAASGVKRMSNSPGVISGAMSAKGGLSALINENSEQIKIIRSKILTDKILEHFIMAISCWLSTIDFQPSAKRHCDKAVACNKHENNAYIGVSKLNYFNISLKKKIAKAESGHLSVINCLYIFWFYRTE